jgi:uncharacterized protein
MEEILDEIQVRVLGVLIEKQLSTPEYYPMSLNSLVNACNQKSNRNPIVEFDDQVVFRALNQLRKMQFGFESSGSRVTKFGQNFTNIRNLLGKESAVLAELMLRGPQTPGELKTRSERMHRFVSLEDLYESIAELNDAEMIVKLPRQPGRKESRYAHLLLGEPQINESDYSGRPEPARVLVQAEDEKVLKLEKEVKELKEKLEELTNAFNDFKSQFE